MEDRIRELDAQIDASNRELERLKPEVDPTLLSEYDRLRHSLPDPVAEVVKGICQGCQVGIPMQMSNELYNPAIIHTCPTCTRILYVTITPKQDEEQDADA